MIWYMIWYDMIWYDMIWLTLINPHWYWWNMITDGKYDYSPPKKNNPPNNDWLVKPETKKTVELTLLCLSSSFITYFYGPWLHIRICNKEPECRHFASTNFLCNPGRSTGRLPCGTIQWGERWSLSLDSRRERTVTVMAPADTRTVSYWFTMSNKGQTMFENGDLFGQYEYM